MEKGKIEEYREKSREAVELAKQQMDFYFLHKSYQRAKEEAVAAFLVN